MIHAWDIARATGQDETIPPDDVHRLYEQVKEMGDMLRTNGVCGPEVEVPGTRPSRTGSSASSAAAAGMITFASGFRALREL